MANKLLRMPVTCPICGKIHTHMPAEYRSIMKTGKGVCCSIVCARKKTKLTKAKNWDDHFNRIIAKTDGVA